MTADLSIRPVKTTCISFGSEMINAIRDDLKTQTRRICSHRHGISFLGSKSEWDDPAAWGYSFDGPDHSGYMVLGRGLDERMNHGSISLPSPYGEAGDRLTVLEGHTLSLGRRASRNGSVVGSVIVRYLADDKCAQFYVPIAVYDDLASKVTVQKERGRPGRFMPRWASRLTLEVTSIRVERVSAISEEDAKAEGVTCMRFSEPGDELGDEVNGVGCAPPLSTYAGAFEHLWGEINGAESWAAGVFVWCVGFRKVVS